MSPTIRLLIGAPSFRYAGRPKRLKTVCRLTKSLDRLPDLRTTIAAVTPREAGRSIRTHALKDPGEGAAEFDWGRRLELQGRNPHFRPLASKVHLPFLREKLAELGMRGQSWVAQITVGFPLIGEVSEKGVYPHNKETSPPIPKSELLDLGPERCKARKSRRKSPRDSRLREEAPPRVGTGWLEGTCEPSRDAALAQQRSPSRINQTEKLRAAGVLKRSSTSRTAQVLRPVNTPHGATSLRHQIASGEMPELAFGVRESGPQCHL